ncbi:hypothetical protein ColLi_12218 [Colletotrichum liriopes]|uniref:Uncharacterized protein n=1 Tax=Colletotrichum liriopes TaxID=708192 RepID=A0AA37LXQ5_9PEZI|nr:hypothetical protein ColLi_12218 [Colletotrichum liriopes]
MAGKPEPASHSKRLAVWGPSKLEWRPISDKRRSSLRYTLDKQIKLGHILTQFDVQRGSCVIEWPEDQPPR